MVRGSHVLLRGGGISNFGVPMFDTRHRSVNISQIVHVFLYCVPNSLYRTANKSFRIVASSHCPHFASGTSCVLSSACCPPVFAQHFFHQQFFSIIRTNFSRMTSVQTGIRALFRLVRTATRLPVSGGFNGVLREAPFTRSRLRPIDNLFIFFPPASHKRDKICFSDENSAVRQYVSIICGELLCGQSGVVVQIG